MAQWLDTEVPNALACEAARIGYGSVTGETRGKVVEVRENTRARVLEKALTLVSIVVFCRCPLCAARRRAW